MSPPTPSASLAPRPSSRARARSPKRLRARVELGEPGRPLDGGGAAPARERALQPRVVERAERFGGQLCSVVDAHERFGP